MAAGPTRGRPGSRQAYFIPICPISPNGWDCRETQQSRGEMTGAIAGNDAGRWGKMGGAAAVTAAAPPIFPQRPASFPAIAPVISPLDCCVSLQSQPFGDIGQIGMKYACLLPGLPLVGPAAISRQRGY